jgi:hypothetical protein
MLLPQYYNPIHVGKHMVPGVLEIVAGKQVFNILWSCVKTLAFAATSPLQT